MATYVELRGLFADPGLTIQVEVACIVAAETIRGEDAGVANHINRLAWAKLAFSNPLRVARQMIMALLAADKDMTIAQITGATDAAVQARVDVAVNVFADGL